jgi:hypothetical protein
MPKLNPPLKIGIKIEAMTATTAIVYQIFRLPTKSIERAPV